MAVDAAGNLYIADAINNRIRRVDVTTGIITTVAGSGTAGFVGGFSGDALLDCTPEIPLLEMLDNEGLKSEVGLISPT